MMTDSEAEVNKQQCSYGMNMNRGVATTFLSNNASTSTWDQLFAGGVARERERQREVPHHVVRELSSRLHPLSTVCYTPSSGIWSNFRTLIGSGVPLPLQRPARRDQWRSAVQTWRSPHPLRTCSLVVRALRSSSRFSRLPLHARHYHSTRTRSVCVSQSVTVVVVVAMPDMFCVEDQRALQLAFELSKLSTGFGETSSPPPSGPGAEYGESVGFIVPTGGPEESRNKKSQNMTECVPVPSSEHVAEIVGRQGKNSYSLMYLQ